MGKKTTLIIVAALFAVSTACNIRPPGQTPTPVVQPAPTQAPAPPAPTPVVAPAPPAPTAVPAKPAPQPTPPPSSGGVSFCNKTFPSGSVLFPVGKPADDRYSVVFDPSQSGVAGREPRGWWYQPCLPPAAERQQHELSLVLVPGRYDFTGPECRAWLNTRGDDSTAWERGRIIVDRQNTVVDVVPTNGRNESWVAVRCQGGAASGFSFSRIG